MHKVATARRVPAAFGVFWNYRSRLVPCEAYTMGADGCLTSGDDAPHQQLADAYDRGATFLTYEASLTLEAAQARAVECGPNYSALPLPAGWYFYDGEQLCVVAPAEPAKVEASAPTLPSFTTRRYFVGENYCVTHPANAAFVLVIYEDLSQGIRDGEQPARSYTLIPLKVAA